MHAVVHAAKKSSCPGVIYSYRGRMLVAGSSFTDNLEQAPTVYAWKSSASSSHPRAAAVLTWTDRCAAYYTKPGAMTVERSWLVGVHLSRLQRS